MTDPTFTFSWEIKKFSFVFCEVCQEIQSDSFRVPILDNTSWKVVFHPEFIKKSISLHVKSVDDIKPDIIKLSVTFKLFNKDGSIAKESTLSFDPRESDEAGFSDFATLDDCDRYLNNDSLRIQCVLIKLRTEPRTMTVRATTLLDVQKVSDELTLPNFKQIRHGYHLTFPFCTAEDLLLDLNLNVVGKIGMEAIGMHFIRSGPEKQNVEGGNDDGTEPLTVIAQITVLDASGSKSDLWKKDRHVFKSRSNSWYFPTFLHKSQLMKEETKYLLNKALTIKCELSISKGKTKNKNIGQPIWVEKPGAQTEDEFKKHIQDIYRTMRFADIKLRGCDDDGDDTCLMPAHRFLLEARSKTFADLLHAHKDADVLVLSDLTTRTLQSLIKYIYTEEEEEFQLEMKFVELGLKVISDNDMEDAVELYRAGHKYQVKTLQCHYSFHFQSQLTVRNVCKYLMLADECDDVNLKNSAVEFIVRYMKQVAETEEWKNLDREKHLLAQQVRDEASRTFVLKHCL